MDKWWTKSQVAALWIKDTFILDTSWAYKERGEEKKGSVKERKAEGSRVQDGFPAQQAPPLKISLP